MDANGIVKILLCSPELHAQSPALGDFTCIGSEHMEAHDLILKVKKVFITIIIVLYLLNINIYYY